MKILVFYKRKGDWNVKNGEADLNRLWKNFNLAFIGYKNKCLVLNYKRYDVYLTEYLFPILYFNIENFHSLEFQQYAQTIDFSFEEFELFQSFRSQLDSSFNLFRQNNLAITNQEDELMKLKTQTEMALESFEIQKKECSENLEAIKKEIKYQKIFFEEEYHKCNEARRRLRYYQKKKKVQEELKTCEVSVAVAKIPKE